MHFANDLVDVRTKVALLLSEQDNLVGNNLEHQEDHATKLYMFINFMESMDEWISQVMTSWAHYHLKRSRLQEQLQEASSDDLWQALILTDITHGQELCSVLYTLLLRYIWLEDIVREAQATVDPRRTPLQFFSSSASSRATPSERLTYISHPQFVSQFSSPLYMIFHSRISMSSFES